MRRRIVKGLLIAGVVLGFAGGFLHLGHHRHHRFEHHERELMQELARECVQAARTAETKAR